MFQVRRRSGSVGRSQGVHGRLVKPDARVSSVRNNIRALAYAMHVEDVILHDRGDLYGSCFHKEYCMKHDTSQR